MEVIPFLPQMVLSGNYATPEAQSTKFNIYETGLSGKSDEEVDGVADGEGGVKRGERTRRGTVARRRGWQGIKTLPESQDTAEQTSLTHAGCSE